MSAASILKSSLNRALGVAGVRLVRSYSRGGTGDPYRDALRRRCELIIDEAVHGDERRPPTEHQRRWRSALVDELEFWYVSVALDGWDWRDAFHERLAGDQPFGHQDYVRQFADTVLEVLDVGAGAFPVIGTRMEGKTINLTSVDPLAAAYQLMLRDLGLPPTPVIEGDAERLGEIFPAPRFHFVNASNCLDHCYDPAAALKAIYEVMRPGGTALLGHYENVAEHASYSGLHQWNMKATGGRLLLWRPGERSFADEHLPEGASLEVMRNPDGWTRVVIRKAE